MALDSLYLCSRCRSKFDLSNVRYDNRGNLACLSCLGKSDVNTRFRMIAESQSPPYLNFICAHCRFKFTMRKDSPRKPVCPYCGKTNLMQIKKYKDENDLIREASDSRFE